MWTPPEKIRHALPVLRVPTRDEAWASRLFAPLTVGRLALAERTWVPAMVPWRATEEGETTEAVCAWYERFARGEPGALVVEATGIRDVPSGPLLRASHDRYLAGLAEIPRRVRAASGGRTRLFVQLIDFLRIRRRPQPERFLREHLVLRDEHAARWADVLGEAPPADLREALVQLDAQHPELVDRVLDAREREALRMGARERVTDVERAEIRDLPRTLPALFAEAAARAETAGFDGVELHYAHAYTMASFLSARNDRRDGYGASR